MTEGGQRNTIRAMCGAIGALATMDRAAAAVALALAVAGAIAEGFGLLLLAPILGLLKAGGGADAHAWAGSLGVATPARLVPFLIGAFVAAMVARGWLLYRRDLAMQQLQARFVDMQRLRVMRALATAPWAKVAAVDHARITALVGIDIARVSAVAYQIIQLIVAAVLLVVQLVVIAVLTPAFALLVVAGMGTGAALLLRQASARARGRNVVAAGQDMMATASGFLGGLKVAAAQRMRDRFVAEFTTSQDRARDWNLAFQRDQALARLGFALGSAIALAAVVLVGVFVLGVAPARLIVIIVVLARMVGPTQSVQQSLQGIAFGLPAFEAVAQVEHRFGGTPAVAAPHIAAPPSGTILLRDVTYRHSGGGGVSVAALAIPTGAIVGITGPSGSGKTTLIDLIAGLLPPQSGTITIEGQAIDDRGGSAISYVGQDGFLFHDTVRRNLDWGDPAIDETAMRAALTLTGADAIIARMPQGLDTIIGERGALLSGGERQRLGIARAILRKPHLLILDEATNALDEASERLLLGRLAALDPRPTMLLVAHRESALAECDHIVGIEHGIAQPIAAIGRAA